uniref:DOMON domain-containing protein n=1 Tax=Panagrolaimus sp. PS1159 TaxID=55785 RepID=A0AC35FBP2_9BILA
MVNSAPISVNLNQKLCSFKAGDYSLQWAFEPQSKNVVFVLKQKSEFNNFWTGVGFGDRKKGNIDFIGVFVKNGQIGIADTHIIPDNDGNLIPDPSTNVQSIAFDYHNKTVTAKFARALKSPDDKFDQSLDGCQIFNFAINGGSISRSGIVPDFDEIAEKQICDIDKNCVVDIRQHLKPSTSESPENIDTKAIFSDKNVKNRNDDTTVVEDGLASMVMYWVLYSPSLDISTSVVQTNKNNKKITKPEFAESVDISGTGDPCSFAGNGYNVNWTYNTETEMVEFSMKHPIRMGKWWSAVGIGDTMADMDIAIMFISSGRPKRIRDYLSKSYGVPDEDKQQDWILSRHRTKSVDEMIELGFSRKLETTDTEKDRSLDGCVLFQFAANAGHYGSGFAVRKHEEWPDLYKACDIKKHCTKNESASKEEEEISESND